MQNLMVLEANEISPKVFKRFAERRPGSAVAAMFERGRFIETQATDVPAADLYPSQTWASMNTGRPFGEHRVYWYNDQKRYADFYWHQVAQKRSAVLVNTLHSSPLHEYVDSGRFDLVIPDCFAADDSTKPASYEPFQHLNRTLVQRNGRRSFVVDTLLSSAKAFIQAPQPGRWGLGGRSVQDVTKLLSAAVRGEREQLRAAQFPLLAQIFVEAIRKSKPGLAVLFTNHVAAMQHRYWYALFPQDYPNALYPNEWVERHGNAILSAMDLLDRWLALLMRMAVELDYTILITTSMGQAANTRLSRAVTEVGRHWVVRDPDALMAGLDPGQDDSPEVEGAMAPQYTYRYASADAAAAAKSRIDALRAVGLDLRCETSGPKLTVTVDAHAPEIQLGNRLLQASELGFTEVDVDDHHSGRHDPAGSMFVFNDRSGVFERLDGEVDYLAVAPIIKNAWG